MRCRTIAIVGASARAAAHSARRSGTQPITADLFADDDLRCIAAATRIESYPDGFLDWMSTRDVDGWMYTGALENYPTIVERLSALRPLWGNSTDVLRRVRCPIELAAELQNAQLLVPETRPTAGGLPLDGSWLCKTGRGSSGSGVWPLDSQLAASRAAAKRAFVQRRLEGVPISAVYVAARRQATLLGACRQLVGEGWCSSKIFQFCGAIGPWPLHRQTLAVLERIGGVVADRFQIVGLFGVDMIHNADGLWTLEINPRYTASVEVVERFTGLASIAAHTEACCQGQLPALCPMRTGDFAGKAILFARQSASVSQALHRWALAGSARSPWPTVADVPCSGMNIDAGKPVMTLFAEGPDPNAVEARLRRQVAQAEARLYAPTPPVV